MFQQGGETVVFEYFSAEPASPETSNSLLGLPVSVKADLEKGRLGRKQTRGEGISNFALYPTSEDTGLVSKDIHFQDQKDSGNILELQL